jgi:hypothetical protein
MSLILQLAHEQMGILRVWGDVDPSNPYTTHLTGSSAIVLEGEVPQPDGSVRHRYSSL